MPRRKVISIAPPIEQVQQESPPELPDKLLKVEEVMEMLGVSRTEIYNLMKRGMPHYKLGKRQRNLRFVRIELAVWLKEQKIS